MARIRLYSYLAFGFFLLVNLVFWNYAHTVRAKWANVPPVPSATGAAAFALGDSQFIYRAFGLMLQNLGDMGGRMTKLQDYDYNRLGGWFFLEDKLDRHSNFIPMQASYYFGGTKVPEDLDPVIEYLAYIGQRPEGRKWRWLVHAVYLARYGQNDQEKALELAYILAYHPNPDRPAWTRAMPAFVLKDMGEKEAAYELMLNILKDRGEGMDPAEVNFTRAYICENLMDEAQIQENPLCEGFR